MHALYRIFAVLALIVACVTAETVLTAEKHVVSFNNKLVTAPQPLRRFPTHRAIPKGVSMVFLP
jgi:hypothetical protein